MRDEIARLWDVRRSPYEDVERIYLTILVSVDDAEILILPDVMRRALEQALAEFDEKMRRTREILAAE